MDGPAVVVLNELAQGARPLAEGVTWFESFDADERSRILHLLAEFCRQAHATVKDWPASIRAAGINPTDTPAVLISRGSLEYQLMKITGLPEGEWVQVFRLLVSLLGTADVRRRARSCAAGCQHTWHHLGLATDTPWPVPAQLN
jgi:hypothetical protein